MPTVFTVKGLPSNKQGNETKSTKIDGKRVCYWPLQGRVVVLKPIIDKLSIVYKIADPDLTAVIAESLLQEAASGEKYAGAKNFKSGAVSYAASVLLTTPSNGSTVLIQAQPKTKKVSHQLRLEFNPAALGPVGIAYLKSEIESIQADGLSFDHIVATGTVTRVDIAVDVIGIAVDRLLIEHAGKGKSLWYYSTTGSPETGYFGIKPSNKNAPWISYNKRKHLKETGEPAAFNEVSHTRIEFRAKPNMELISLAALKNPFTQMSIGLPSRPNGVEDYAWQHFLDSCQRRGVKAALALITDASVQQKYSDAIVVAQKDFWRPESIWNSWPAAIQKAGLT